MKKLIVFTLLLIWVAYAKADHITGGEMSYVCTPEANGMVNYRVTLKIYMRCNSGREFISPTFVSVFNRSTSLRIKDVSVSLSNQQPIQFIDASPCITNPPIVCYIIGTYQFVIELPQSADGYILSSQVNYRIAGISNLGSYADIGATYMCEVPGTSPVTTGPINNSAKFIGSDLVVICANNRFSYSFAASDDDGDQLRYSFCDAYVSGTSIIGGSTEIPPLAPPYSSVPYGSGYAGYAPLGNNVSIDENTGLITGIAPSAGIYVVTVCVQEVRNGIVIATQRKDLQINIADCDIAAARLEPEYQLCRDTKTLSVNNLSNSPLIKLQEWEFQTRSGLIVFDTMGTTATYTFADSGLYTIKLVINRGEVCTDSTTSVVRVYPGFAPAFVSKGICFGKPTTFVNTTTTVYGAVNSWKWDLGDQGVAADTSSRSTVSYTYQSMGPKNALLTVGNLNGCQDTATRSIFIFDKPPLNLAFRDTLICLSDKVQLLSNGTGSYKWTPAINITNGTTASPTVSPVNTTTYYVDLNDQGCLNRDSVLVRVTDHVTLIAMNDTVICQGDPVQLHIVSDGFQYSWTPAAQIVNPNIPEPFVITNAVTTYQVTAFIGSCSAKDQVKVIPVPYPVADAGNDTLICFNTAAQLHGKTDGKSYQWSPQTSLTNSQTLDPVSRPSQTTIYILSATDTNGCPKAGIDSVSVTVLPNIHPFAGNDTSIVTGQDLQLNASGGSRYIWSPSAGLSSSGIANPVARFNEGSTGSHYVVTVYNEANCSDTASINIKVFSTLPSVFVPNAFTPNRDGKNDLLRAIPAGIKRLEYFSVYDRWGKLMFSTNDYQKGWDGTINGIPQDTAVFVWMVKAIDYKNTVYFKKGSVVLIR